MSESPRPTREQVEADLATADRAASPDSVGARLAAEVRALRADLEEALGLRAAMAARPPRTGRIVDAAEDVARLDVLIALAPADYPGLPGLRRHRDELLTARTPQPPESVQALTKRLADTLDPAVEAQDWDAVEQAQAMIHEAHGAAWRAAPQPAVPDGPATPASVDVRMESPTAPDWGGELTDDGRQLYHHAWDSTDETLRLWVGPYTAEQSDPSWAVTVRADGVDVVMRCTPTEVVEWADEVKAAVALSGVLPAPQPAVPDGEDAPRLRTIGEELTDCPCCGVSAEVCSGVSGCCEQCADSGRLNMHAVTPPQAAPAPLSDLDARQVAAVPALLAMCDEAEDRLQRAARVGVTPRPAPRGPVLTTREVRAAVASAVPGEDVPARLDAALAAYHEQEEREPDLTEGGVFERCMRAAVAAALDRAPHEEAGAS